jgi:hypothetical protein
VNYAALSKVSYNDNLFRDGFNGDRILRSWRRARSLSAANYAMELRDTLGVPHCGILRKRDL